MSADSLCRINFNIQDKSKLNQKNILIVIPTIGEVLQCGQFLAVFKKEYKNNKVWALIDDEESFGITQESPYIDNVIIYPHDTKELAKKVLAQTDPWIIIFIENCYYYSLLAEATRLSNKTTMLLSAAMNNFILHHPQYENCYYNEGYQQFTRIGVKSKKYIKSFIELNVKQEQIFVSGDLKIDMNRLTMAENEKIYYHKIFGTGKKKLFIAGSISRDEAEIILGVFRKVLNNRDNVQCIVAPRFLKNVNYIYKLAEKLKLDVARRTDIDSKKNNFSRQNDVIVLDTYGELGKIYGLGDVVFVGGTLKPFKNKPLGQNILEPLFNRKPLIVGPNVKKDFDVISLLKDFWPYTMINDSNELYKSISYVLGDSYFHNTYSQFVEHHIGLNEPKLDHILDKISEIRKISHNQQRK